MEKIYEFKKGELELDSNLYRWELIDQYCKEGEDFEYIGTFGEWHEIVKVEILRDFKITIKLEYKP